MPWNRIKYLSPAMADLIGRAKKVAATDRPLLLLGERGTGKTLLAEVVHKAGARAARPLVMVNCATLTPTLAESELFGHERGAFTGAEARSPGYFEQAHTGTLFLDEVADLPPEVQAHLLSAVERNRIRRVGARSEIAVDVRLISATNRNFDGGKLREDLVDRLGVLKLVVPPLRERREDIPAIARAIYAEIILEEASADMTERYPAELPKMIIDRLVEEPWPGNVRQLRSALINLVTFNTDGGFGEEDIQFAIQQATTNGAPARPPAHTVLPVGVTLPQYLDQLRTEFIEEALRTSGGDVAHAAKLLGVSRQNIHQVLKRRGS